MDTVSMLRDLWRSRFAVLGVFVLALLTSIVVLYSVFPPSRIESRRYKVGVATTSLLIDTPSSQVVAISPDGSGDLGGRADLLARLMVNGVIKEAIAKTAGVNPDRLIGISSGATATTTGSPPRDAPVLTTSVTMNSDGTELPIIQIEAQTSDTATATRLANAAVAGLRDYLDNKAAAQHVPDDKRVKVDALGVTQAQMVVRGPSPILAIVAALFVFGLGCGCILAVVGIKRGWRRAIEMEKLPPHMRYPVAVHPHGQAVAAHAPVSYDEHDRMPVQPASAPPAVPATRDTWLAPPSTLRSVDGGNHHPRREPGGRAASAG